MGKARDYSIYVNGTNQKHSEVSAFTVHFKSCNSAILYTFPTEVQYMLLDPINITSTNRSFVRDPFGTEQCGNIDLLNYTISPPLLNISTLVSFDSDMKNISLFSKLLNDSGSYTLTINGKYNFANETIYQSLFLLRIWDPCSLATLSSN